MRRLTYFLIGALVFLASVPAVQAQSFQGGIRGAVKDTAGAMIPGVEVSLINEGTNVARNTVTNEAGQYVFASVAPATYKLRASLAGFKTFDRAAINSGK